MEFPNRHILVRMILPVTHGWRMRCDAGVLAQPTTLQAKKAGLRELVDLSNISIEYPSSCIVSTK